MSHASTRWLAFGERICNDETDSLLVCLLIVLHSVMQGTETIKDGMRAMQAKAAPTGCPARLPCLHACCDTCGCAASWLEGRLPSAGRRCSDANAETLYCVWHLRATLPPTSELCGLKEMCVIAEAAARSTQCASTAAASVAGAAASAGGSSEALALPPAEKTSKVAVSEVCQTGTMDQAKDIEQQQVVHRTLTGARSGGAFPFIKMACNYWDQRTQSTGCGNYAG
jgi:hypothetical protein